MAVFAIIATPDNNLIADAIGRNFPRHFQFGPKQYVVAADGLTAQQVSERLGLNGTAGQFVAFSIAGHFGFYRKDLWEWLTLNSG